MTGPTPPSYRECDCLVHRPAYFYQLGVREVRKPAGPKIALCFPRLFVCLSVCLCVRTYHVRNVVSCVTVQLQSTTVLTAFGGL